ncbi:hypothetical protein NEOLEDRAFT_1128451 [Neolentinus lepideus HHB14362 ss-1]|uniref:Uncharacterized protein n=1 Tax=Neolentinus lepideus HHB14362 ss-1 TaxID=1314782 RepID=A0A165V0D1_9AGAM|nr:hypothetical protein NEOLEDRAFT_1128451 [Neolentinus lepideus HHB14362 ss-1]
MAPSTKRDPDWKDSDSDGSDNGPASEGFPDVDWEPSTSKKPPAKRQKRGSEHGGAKARQPNLKARITVLATDSPPAAGDAKDRLQGIDDAVLERIKKALALAQHENTGEQEAKQAMRMASKLMSQYSVTQADLLAKEDDAQKLKRAGMSVVIIEHIKQASVRWETWAADTAYAMTIFFDCQMYTETFGRYGNVRACFYGLAEQTVAGAYAFEMAYNLISRWGLDNNKAKGVRQKNLYKRGVAQGLIALANKEKKAEVQKAIEAEQARLRDAKKIEAEEDRRRLDRLNDPQSEVVAEQPDRKVKVEEVEDAELGSRSHSASNGSDCKKEEEPDAPYIPTGNYPAYDDYSDDELGVDPRMDTVDDEDEYRADFDASDDIQLDLDALESKVKNETSANPVIRQSTPEPTLKPEIKDDIEAGPSWQSEGQLIAFRENTKSIADEYLKSQGVKLGKGRRMPDINLTSKEDHKLWEQGKKDAEKIDVRRRRLKGAEED